MACGSSADACGLMEALERDDSDKKRKLEGGIDKGENKELCGVRKNNSDGVEETAFICLNAKGTRRRRVLGTVIEFTRCSRLGDKEALLQGGSFGKTLVDTSRLVERKAAPRGLFGYSFADGKHTKTRRKYKRQDATAWMWSVGGLPPLYPVCLNPFPGI